MTGLVAVVLAGGRSTRFGSDKLAASAAGMPLLDRALAGLSPDAEIVVVGPARALARTARFVREDPPGGGPTAALVAGLRWALETSADVIVVLPGDAPNAGVGAQRLRDTLLSAEADVVVATDREGRLQPLQLAMGSAGAARLVAAAGPSTGRNASARRLIESLDPPATRVMLPDDAVLDIDTPAELANWRASTSSGHLRKSDRA